MSMRSCGGPGSPIRIRRSALFFLRTRLRNHGSSIPHSPFRTPHCSFGGPDCGGLVLPFRNPHSAFRIVLSLEPARDRRLRSFPTPWPLTPILLCEEASREDGMDLGSAGTFPTPARLSSPSQPLSASLFLVINPGARPSIPSPYGGLQRARLLCWGRRVFRSDEQLQAERETIE